ncbi:MAG: NADH-quinone oxidoreductase subunit NuoF [Candidatus Abyssobacteria bacterium SURF_17]|uniref:NADH-quinone oxidoreductase subunit NuoF n=1 Tax=Candidatus Abyssobacteria bacterium SURF_17 TaxID=2093361 RepID=A0A419ESB0_9BACT|nr:MAG: NADH-quinone oxidoreductase subunit NuoF [Candidatus Abyssubacteria bacterium SURF_17]
MARRILTADDLKAIQKNVAKEREKYRLHAMLCGGTGCHAGGGKAVLAALKDEVNKRGLSSDVRVVETGCNGFCALGPVMTILPEKIFYQKLAPEDVAELVENHFIKGRPVERLMYTDPVTGNLIPRLDEIPFFAHQQLRVLHNKGLIDPEKIEDYIWRDGYTAALKAFIEMTPREIIAEVKASGLRGRGGAGFPTGVKWEFCANSKGDVKYVLCNADEGDPGAFMDRSVMEADPHSVLEGMLIAAKAIDSHQGYIYCRAEYPLAVKRLNIAIEQAREYGLLGKNIFGSGFDFDVEIYQGAGAFVCGEETALMTSIEGRRGMPRPRPPFPAISGLWKKPTILNNVETFSNIPQIIIEGGDACAKIGTESSKGTKIFALTGKVNNIGLVEVPMGTSVGEIIFDIGGGIPGGKKFKAAQLGGPSGGCIPSEHLNTPTDYEAIARAGAIMGSGGMIVMDEDTCMVDMARYFMDFCQDESCGKCTPCRVGTRRMLEILQRICNGKGLEGDIELLEEMAQNIKDTALCGLGQTAPNPVLSTIRYFRNEYEAHIRDKRCPAAVCSALFKSPCQHTCPVGMDIPAYVALVRAGRIDDAYVVLKRTNPFPSVCGRVCGHPCQAKCRRGQLDEPVAIKFIKRYIADNASRPKVEPIPVTRKERVAVIGAGPSGLTAALELKKRGYAVTVFEELPQAGGMLRWGIPAYRLPREVLDREINDILDTGVELRTNTRIGREVSFEKLEKEYDVIYFAVGAQRSYGLDVPGETAEGVLGAVEMLRAQNLDQDVKIGKRVAVIGGGNSAVDAARTAIRLGAEAVTIYYRRERKDMPAQEAEIKASEDEGVRIEYLVAPVRVISDNGRVSGLELNRMKLGQFDRSGRKRPEPIPGSEFTIDVDTVIAAIGQKPDLDCLPKASGVETSRNTVKVDRTLRTTNAKVWAGGDVVTGPAMVIDAIKAGQNAAARIDMAIREENGEKPWVPPSDGTIDIPFEVDEEVVERPQAAMPEVAALDRRRDFREVEFGYTKKIAMAEARRCMRCDAKIE